MTVVTESRVSASLLYVAMDLGPEPTMVRFSRQTNCVNALWRHCLNLSVVGSLEPPQREALWSDLVAPVHHRDPLLGELPDPTDGPWDSDNPADRLRAVAGATPLLISRTSLASPWVSVLTTVAEKSAPVAYGAAALFGMQRLLNMVIAWQRHRIEMQQAKSVLTQGTDQLLVRHATEELRAYARPHAGSTAQPSAIRIGADPAAAIAVEDLAPVLEAKMVDENDPLARG